MNIRVRFKWKVGAQFGIKSAVIDYTGPIEILETSVDDSIPYLPSRGYKIRLIDSEKITEATEGQLIAWNKLWIRIGKKYYEEEKRKKEVQNDSSLESS